MIFSFFKKPRYRKFEYRPLYYDESKDRRRFTEQRINFRRGALMNEEGEGISGKLRSSRIADKYRYSKGRRLRMMAYLIAMMGVIYACYVYNFSLVGTFFFVLVLLILFIWETNRL